MTSRTEFRVVVERDGLQWPLPSQHNEPITDRGAAEAYRLWVVNYGEREAATTQTGHRVFACPFDRVFVVHRQVTETGWETDDGQPWDGQAARDGVILARLDAEGHAESAAESNAAAVVASDGHSGTPREVDQVTEAVRGSA